MSNLSKHIKHTTKKSSNYRAEFIRKEQKERHTTIAYFVISAICVFIILIANYRTYAIPFKDYRPVTATVEQRYKWDIPEHRSSVYSADLSYKVDEEAYYVVHKPMNHYYDLGETVTIYYNANHPKDTRPTTSEIIRRLLFSAIPFVVAAVLIPEGIKRVKKRKN